MVGNLGLPRIPPEEGGTDAAGASAALGEAATGPVVPHLKGGSSHNPAKGKQPRQGKEKQPAQGKDKQPAQEKDYEAFVMSEGLPPVPAKLVGKICRGEFVDMAEMLRDNIEAERHRGTATEPSKLSGHRRREIPDILSWIKCFGTYACVVASQHPEKVTQRLAYQTTVIREARRCGGAGWQGYDAMFRQHAASAGAEADWSKLNSSLFAVTFLAQQNGRGKTCEYCLEADHVAAECALAPTRPAEPQPPVRQPLGQGSGGADSQRPGDNRDFMGAAGGRSRALGRAPVDRICYSWNDGFCRFQPRCRFKHECARCGGDHRATDCPRRPAPLPRQKESPVGRSG